MSLSTFPASFIEATVLSHCLFSRLLSKIYLSIRMRTSSQALLLHCSVSIFMPVLHSTQYTLDVLCLYRYFEIRQCSVFSFVFFSPLRVIWPLRVFCGSTWILRLFYLYVWRMTLGFPWGLHWICRSWELYFLSKNVIFSGITVKICSVGPKSA